MTKTIAILGAGKIGQMACHFLARCGDYTVRIGDVSNAAVQNLAAKHKDHGVEPHVVDFEDAQSLDAILKDCWGVLSCAPFHCNPLIADRAKAAGTHYFDLTEDVAVTQKVQQLAEGASTAFAPQCGLAPGFITIAAAHLMRRLDSVRDLRLRVGALPQNPNNRLKYNLTWSTEGLINEYCNPCEAIEDGLAVVVPPMEQLELLTVDGVEYEAFNTSGGLGTLAHTLSGKVQNLNYKSMRYPGHCEQMKLLLHDLGMRAHQDELKKIFERSIAFTPDDQIVIYVGAAGDRKGRYTQLTYAKVIKAQQIDGTHWTGIQVTTAAGVCAIIDMVKDGQLAQDGFIKMEQVDYDAFLKNRFGRYYA
jgi:saccharopine dehydrogenase-like NADP-dependent oxidoreductase